MLRHAAVFRWIEGTTPEQVEELAAALRALPAQVPAIRSYEVGSDLGLGEGRWDFAVVASFDDADGYQDYVDHPAHQAIATDLIPPIRADRVHIQLEV